MGEIITDISQGIITRFEITGLETFNVTRTQDVEKILDQNKRDQNDKSFRNGWSESGDMKHVARIPLIVLEQWAKKHGIPKKDIFGDKMTEIIRKELNDPDNLFLRTGLGTI